MARGAAAAVMPAPSVRSGSGMGQTVTIINNSGKIVNTGKQLVSLFKEVSSTYKDKKAELKLRRFLQRSAADEPPNVNAIPRTRDYEPSVGSRADNAYRHEDEGTSEYRLEDGRRPRRAHDDQSVASSRRSHRSRHSARSERPRSKSIGQSLTENNLDRLTEVSGTAPSRASGAYRSPYAESIQPGAVTRAIGTEYERSIAAAAAAADDDDDDDDDDMHLAYGSLPPDLAQRRDLSPDPMDQVERAQSLVHRIEDLLDEVECVEHTASEMIRHLQERPDAAAAVALTLAELSAFVGKLSPGFLGVLKGGSPAVFALLASPQFLIGTGIAVGMTVVMFGGWKIVQRAQAAQEPRQALALEANPNPAAPAPAARPPTEVEEALVLKRMEEELSTIESWRRGIVANSNWEKETAEMELITPKAKSRHIPVRHRNKDDDDDDTRSHRSSRTHKSSRSSAYTSHRRPHKEGHHADDHHREEHHREKSRRGDDGVSVASQRSSGKKPREPREPREHAEGKRGGKEGELKEKPKEKSSMLKKIFKSKDKERVSA